MFQRIKENIAQTSPETKLLIVSKYQELDKIEPFCIKGHQFFAENKVQEAKTKWPILKQKFPNVELHMIGHLQSNKAKEAIKLFDWIHTVDRISLAEEIFKLSRNCNIIPNLMIQVNTGEEFQKGGILPQDLEKFIKICIHDFHLPIKGLMTILPQFIEPSLHFCLLKKLSKKYKLPITSMGMSDDYEIALPFQPTYIRIGRSLFS